MPDFNKVIIMGNLTQDPELRYTPSGQPVTDLNIAINEHGKGGKKTTYVEVTVWGKNAENCCEYLQKGACAHIEGKLKLDQWKDKDTGKQRSKLGVVANFVTFITNDKPIMVKPENKDHEISEHYNNDDDISEQTGSDDMPF